MEEKAGGGGESNKRVGLMREIIEKRGRKV